MTVLGCAWKATLCHWRTHLPAVGFVCLATAIVTGALAVQTSIRSHLFEALVDPLGRVEMAVTTNGVFRASLATQGRTSALALNSITTNEDGTLSSQSTVWGLGSDAGTMWPGLGLPEPGKALVSQQLASDMKLAMGSRFFLRIPYPNTAPITSIFGRKLATDSSAEVTVEVSQVLPKGGISDLELVPKVGEQRLAIVDREWIASQLKVSGSANVIFTSHGSHTANGSIPFSLSDYGLTTFPQSNTLTISSKQVLLTLGQVDACRSAARRTGSTVERFGVALAEEVRCGERRLSYTMVGASLDHSTQGMTTLTDWAAKDLECGPPSKLKITMLASGTGGGVDRRIFGSVVSGVLPPSRTILGQHLSPEIAGMTDSTTLSNWRTPFPIDLGRITTRDEQYWNLYRAAPKMFVDAQMVRSSWGGSEPVTAIIVSGGALDRFPAELTKALAAGDSGVSEVPVRANAMAASRGSADLASLLLGLSSFLIISSLGIAGSLVFLNLQSRMREHSLMSYLGLSRWTTFRVLFGEVLIVSILGGLIGSPCGALLAKLSLRMLSVWSPAEAGIRDVVLAFGWNDVLTGLAIGIACAVVACLLFNRPLLSQRSLRVKKLPRSVRLVETVCGLVRRSITYRPIRFVSLALVVAAGTSIIGIAAGSMDSDSSSGTAGFSLMVETAMPVPIDWGISEGRKKLHFDPADEEVLAEMSLTSLLRSPGENVSCLNPAKPAIPRIAGVANDTIRLAPFEATAADGRNAWPLLLGDATSSAAIPGIGDADTLDWILGSRVGGKFDLSLPSGARKQLSFVGATHGTFLSSDLLVSTEGFHAMYPEIGAPTLFLVKTPRTHIAAVRAAILRNLADYGVSVKDTATIVKSLREVVNAYVSIFLVFGSLGLILGVCGSGLAVARNAMDRRPEFALMLSMGIPRSMVGTLMTGETILAVTLGGIVGCAISAVVEMIERSSPMWAAIIGAPIAIGITAIGTSAAVSTVFLRKSVLEALRSE